MNLKDYLEQNKITQTAFALEIGVKPLAVHRYISGARKPEAPVLQKIEEVTGGKVAYEDFYEKDKATA
jgi:transcriptional regulator with XRE-family HTH domain